MKEFQVKLRIILNIKNDLINDELFNNEQQQNKYKQYRNDLIKYINDTELIISYHVVVGDSKNNNAKSNTFVQNTFLPFFTKELRNEYPYK